MNNDYYILATSGLVISMFFIVFLLIRMKLLENEMKVLEDRVGSIYYTVAGNRKWLNNHRSSIAELEELFRELTEYMGLQRIKQKEVFAKVSKKKV